MPTAHSYRIDRRRFVSLLASIGGLALMVKYLVGVKGAEVAATPSAAPK
ncbi:MAG TPA: hypothetical protein VIH91_07640 [Terriglobales bacterium]